MGRKRLHEACELCALLLQERVGRARILGALSLAAGIALIAIAG